MSFQSNQVRRSRIATWINTGELSLRCDLNEFFPSSCSSGRSYAFDFNFAIARQFSSLDASSAWLFLGKHLQARILQIDR